MDILFTLFADKPQTTHPDETLQEKELEKESSLAKLVENDVMINPSETSIKIVLEYARTHPKIHLG